MKTSKLESYRDHCVRSLAKFGDTQDPATAERIAKDGLILASSGADLQLLSRMSDVALRAPPDHWAFAWFQFVKGFSEFRLGNYASARDWMKTVLGTIGDSPRRDIEAYLVLAMAYQKMGAFQDAQDAFSKAMELKLSQSPERQEADLGQYWTDWLIIDALEIEARPLIQIPSVSK